MPSAAVINALQASQLQAELDLTDILNQLATAQATLASIQANPKPSYTINEKEVDWNGYQEMLVDTIQKLTLAMDALNRTIKSINQRINQYTPYIVTTKYVL